MNTLRLRWRQSAALVTLATCLVMAMTAYAPSSASATVGSAAVPLDHVGWVYLVETYDCNHGLPTLMACAPSDAPAWRWNGQAWSHASIDRAQYVYVYPYTGQWRWIWTQRTGWLASSGERFIYRFGYA